MSAALALILLLESAVASDAPLPAAVSRQSGVEDMPVTDVNGHPLYVREGLAPCIGDCLVAWPPFLATENDEPVGDFKPVKGPDGKLQWAYKGSPLYTFARDQAPARASGDGANTPGGRWQALKTIQAPPRLTVPAAAAVGRQGSRFVLTNRTGLALYTFDMDKIDQDGAEPACTGDCLDLWHPLTAPELAVATADWRPVRRADGIRQWAYQGKLLYTFDWDTDQARASGESEAWKVVPVGAVASGPAQAAVDPVGAPPRQR
jgi:predicted lipoprotein with Yx(FWY)xxD motif